MKKVIGSILCVVAVLLIVSKILPQKPETPTEKIQDYALIAVLLTTGVALSQAKKKPMDPSEGD